VVLLQVDGEDGPFGIGKGLGGQKYGVARLIAAARTGIDAPRRFFLSVNREIDGARDAAARVLSLKIAANLFGGLKSAVAFANLILTGLPPSVAGAASAGVGESAALLIAPARERQGVGC
jgi:hypothetical protein